MQLVLESYQNKVGASSNLRRNLIESIMKQLKNNFIPDCQKVIILDESMPLNQKNSAEIS